MEHERRHIEKDDKRRREVDDEKPRTERKEERRKSRERSFERVTEGRGLRFFIKGIPDRPRCSTRVC